MGRNHAVFRQVPSKSIYQLRSLTDEKVSGSKDHGSCLLLFCLNGNEPHGWPRRCLSDSFSVGRVVLLTFHEGLDVSRRDQPDLMAEQDLRCELTLRAWVRPSCGSAANA
jgi:hypothetical protein